MLHTELNTPYKRAAIRELVNLGSFTALARQDKAVPKNMNYKHACVPNMADSTVTVFALAVLSMFLHCKHFSSICATCGTISAGIM